MNKNLYSGAHNQSDIQVRFPALYFSQGLLTAIDSLDSISECTNVGFKTGYFKRLVLVDSKSRKFQVSDARKLRRLPLRFRFEDALGLIDRNPRWLIELVFAPNPAKISLEEVKTLIYGSFEKDKTRWDEMTDLEQLQANISAATSLEQIFATIKGFNLS